MTERRDMNDPFRRDSTDAIPSLTVKSQAKPLAESWLLKTVSAAVRPIQRSGNWAVDSRVTDRSGCRSLTCPVHQPINKVTWPAVLFFPSRVPVREPQQQCEPRRNHSVTRRSKSGYLCTLV